MAQPASTARAPVRWKARAIIGWFAAIVIVVGAAFAVGRIGGAEVPPVEPTPSAGTAASPLPIAFGSALDSTSGEVAADLAADRFTAGDTVAYSVRPASPPQAPELYVEVLRVGGGQQEAVQTPAAQPITPGAEVIAYVVTADALLGGFGPGEYLMRIYLDPAAEPIAEGTFELVDPEPGG
jgi:hypothetical protein